MVRSRIYLSELSPVAGFSPWGADAMSIGQLQFHAAPPGSAVTIVGSPRTAASYEDEIIEHRNMAALLRAEIVKDEDLLRQKDQLIDQRSLANSESIHRLLNDLQIVVSLLSLQSRKSADAETASQLTAAASRVATIARVHRRLQSLDHLQSLALKQFLVDFCVDFSMFLGADQAIAVEGIEILVPSNTGIPLSLIVNELITNAVKYGTGGIAVLLAPDSRKGYALSVSNDGPALPEGFDLTAGNGQGMRIIRSFVERIGGELHVGRRDNGQGTRFTVLFG